MPTKNKAPIPEKMIEAASLALYAVDGTLPDYASRELARNERLRKAMELRATTVLESAHVGELVATLQALCAFGASASESGVCAYCGDSGIIHGHTDDCPVITGRELLAKIKGE